MQEDPHVAPTASADLAAANRAFFDDLAAQYDVQPWQKQMSLQITTFVRQNLDFIGIPRRTGPVALLDYACGTGMMSRALGPSVASVRALDVSPKMVGRFNELAAASEIASVREARAVEGDLVTDREPRAELTGPDFYGFDVAAVGGGLHHFDDPAKAIGRLAQRLKVGGVLLIVDFVEEGAAGHGRLLTHAEHTIRKHGFSEKEMKGMMEAHGMGGFGWKEMPERVEMRFHDDKPVTRQGFLARATKMSVA